MSVAIGDVVLAGSNGPPTIPLSSDLAMTLVELSDGARLVATTGAVPGDMTLTGVLCTYVGGKSPLQQYEVLEGYQRAALPVSFSWTNGTQVNHDARRAPVTITKLAGTIVRAGDVEYSITLTQELAGGLATSTTTRGVKALAAMNALNKTAGGASGPTAAAIRAAHLRYLASLQTHSARDDNKSGTGAGAAGGSWNDSWGGPSGWPGVPGN